MKIREWFESLSKVDLESVAARIKAKSMEKDGCVIWLGRTSAKGYGVINVWCRNLKTRKPIAVHQMAFAMKHGWPDSGLWLFHKCKNKKCINLEHLDAVIPQIFRKFVLGSKNGMCLRGHDQSGQGSRISARLSQVCRECQRLYDARYRARKRGEKTGAVNL